jgi:hypothetical protein
LLCSQKAFVQLLPAPLRLWGCKNNRLVYCVQTLIATIAGYF